jgi:predicted pyridoxine 5'-phosphate oxidase superfamily flavin-nucleotide-binding protein
MANPHLISTRDELAAHYGPVNPNSLAKETPALTPQYRAWPEQSPFFAFASAGQGGLDCSPRGDAVGAFVEVLDKSTIAIPDRRWQ